MKHNQSLKQISMNGLRYLDSEHSQFTSPRNDQCKHANSQQQQNKTYYDKLIDSDSKILKTLKYTRSHKNIKLFTPYTTNFNISSPKYIPSIQTQRKMIINKNNILTPANKNLSSLEQPKKPKILNKIKHSLSFTDQFRIGKVLGKGRFGNVCLAQHIQTGSIFAVKQISLEKVSPKLIERLICQMKIQLFMKHENCLQMYKFYKDGKNLHLVLEIGQSSLFDLLRERKFFAQQQTAYYIRQTINALIYLHQNGVIHRDLKPQNIVLVNNVAKLADFGWSIYTGGKGKRITFCGTLDYVSPEIVLGNEYDEMVDVWSVGVLCYQLCTGHAPFQSTKSRQQTYRKIVNVDLKFPKHLTHQIRSFIKKLLTRKPQKRMTLTSALEHPWLRQYSS